MAALRQRLGLGIDPLDLAPLAAAEQAVMDPQPDLGADLQAGQPDEHLERVDDPAVGRVLQRHEPELDVAAVDLLEDRGDRADRDVLDGLAELGDRRRGGCSCTSARGRRPAAAAASDRLPLISSRKISRKRLGGQRAPAGRQGAVDDLVLARRRPDLQPLLLLDLRRSGATISARRFRSVTSSLSIRSISPRRLASEGLRLASAAATGREAGVEARESEGLRGIGPLGAKTGRQRPGRRFGRNYGSDKWIQKPIAAVKSILPRPRSGPVSLGRGIE